MGIATINPKDTSAFIPLTVQVKFEGELSAVKEAAKAAEKAALEINQPQEVLIRVIEKPYSGTKELAKITKVDIRSGS